ncbi:hypothetical protein HYPSUDRAFT_209480 [Hypholoma sublateritium FD-334 SS-4]|uniref:FMR1-interacting protein 1 conserved domain-containing protein n=1 Tax=Hypholoma sublateritium (strain FD-334 SS-4) TaxID=945553 RepID=A0A0D2KG60_HYPSF|nr:hypothetical protein HYPSUDRAFT_209480 [Hypholoma sublateritium FD-334 SS-4]
MVQIKISAPLVLAVAAVLHSTLALPQYRPTGAVLEAREPVRLRPGEPHHHKQLHKKYSHHRKYHHRKAATAAHSSAASAASGAPSAGADLPTDPSAAGGSSGAALNSAPTADAAAVSPSAGGAAEAAPLAARELYVREPLKMEHVKNWVNKKLHRKRYEQNHNRHHVMRQHQPQQPHQDQTEQQMHADDTAEAMRAGNPSANGGEAPTMSAREYYEHLMKRELHDDLD